MSLLSNLRKKQAERFATATPATFATFDEEKARTVASVATVAVANPPQRQSASPAKVEDDDTATSFSWLIHFTDREPLTVSFSPEATQAEALAGYPDAVAAEPIAPPLPIETSCRDCQHFMRPGHSSGYCAGRDDLPFAYGVNHPLRKLPDDGGASCEQWRIAKERKFDGN